MNKVDYCIMGFFIGLIFELLVLAFLDSRVNKPTALDVYRGRTTLEITYRDTIPIDTLVVFK